MGIARYRAKNRELGHDMAFGDRTENERINKVVEFNSKIDATIPSDRSMLENPNWKPDNKKKWVTTVNFISSESIQRSLETIWPI